ncbi:MAG: polysaccharide deacetylase family protein [Polaromonas sp.]|nr:polysaccharide deacetylase family protein [Polaromonas sp.]
MTSSAAMHRTPGRWAMPPLVVLTLVIHAAALVAVLVDTGWWPWALAAIVANHAVLSVTGLLPRSSWLGSNWTRLPEAAAARGEIAITIDDGPDPVVTPAVLDLLDRHHAKATFFCVGRQAALHPELCREMVRRGHRIENHSQHHRHNFSLLGPRGFRRELEAGQATLAAITGEHPLFFRAPAGLRNPFLDPVLHHTGLQLASWTRRAYDTRVGDAGTVLRKLTGSLRAGDILLLHDRHAALTDAGVPVILDVLPLLLDTIQRAGLRPVTLRDAMT